MKVDENWNSCSVLLVKLSSTLMPSHQLVHESEYDFRYAWVYLQSTLINSHAKSCFSTLINSHANSRFSTLINSHPNSRFSTLVNVHPKVHPHSSTYLCARVIRLTKRSPMVFFTSGGSDVIKNWF
jgi:hypothetical protein